ncbi:MAG: L-methionine gamma-lyase [Saprospiraceae bacterium]|nr:MAG: L-methionine gamma-lyase [Saprospiraceae bacterium]
MIEINSRCVHDAPEKRTTKPHQLPIYATSSFEFDSIQQGMAVFSGQEEGHIYGRFGNPTIDSVAEKITSLETHGLHIPAKGILVSSGMGAISTLVLSVLKSGDKILTQGNIYGGTSALFKGFIAKFGIETINGDLKNPEQLEAMLKKDASIRMIYFETPANPTLACLDIQMITGLARQYNCYAAIDNTFCTPYLQQPFQFGVDFIVHSTTKYLNGHGNSISGIIIGKDVELMQTKVYPGMKLNGTNSNAWDAWLINNGIKTLALRMERHSENALQIAQFLDKHTNVERVNYTGLPSHPDHHLANRQMRRHGGMLSFEMTGGLEAGKTFMNKLQFCTLAPTLGDVDTLILHPASMSHISVPKDIREAYGITDGLVRISVGIEDVRDIIRDLEQALN